MGVGGVGGAGSGPAPPGATAQDVQDQVLNRIERRLQELEHFEYVRSFARQGYGGITLWMKGGSSKKELENAWYQARKKFSDVKSELPEGVIGPIFNDEYGDVTGLLPEQLADLGVAAQRFGFALRLLDVQVPRRRTDHRQKQEFSLY